MLVFVILGDFCKGRRFATSMRIFLCNPWRFLMKYEDANKTRVMFDKNSRRATTMSGLFILKVSTGQQ